MFSRFISKDYYNKAFVLCDKLTASSFAVCYFICVDTAVEVVSTLLERRDREKA